jgi:nitrous oxide reductase accessory protein NosL
MLFRIFPLLFISLSLFAYPQIKTIVKEKKYYPMGQKIYTKLCKKIDASSYKSYESMQEDIVAQGSCKKMNKEHFTALSLYLWDRTRGDKDLHKKLSIKVAKDEKCPVCGMYVYKYPKWATQIFYQQKHLSFDGAKDMMKYYFEHKEGITKILVRDYYTQEVIDASEAYFVIGSDIYGPMGNELIAFSDKKSAKVFYLDHRAKEILRFDQITQELVEGL